MDRRPAKIGKIRKTGRAGIDSGCNGVIQSDLSVDPVKTIFVPVTVQIDEPGTDVCARRISYIGTSSRVKAGGDSRDPVFADSYLGNPIQVLRWVDDRRPLKE